MAQTVGVTTQKIDKHAWAAPTMLQSAMPSKATVNRLGRAITFALVLTLPFLSLLAVYVLLTP